MFPGLLQDLRYALRSLRRSPGFVTVALASLTLGIGANSTLFSLLNAVRFRPLPYREAERLVDLHELNPVDLCAGCSVGTSYATFLDWKQAAASYKSLGAYDEDVFAVSGTETPVRVSGGHVSAELFPTLGVAPMLGRNVAPDEDRLGAPAVVLLSHALWQRSFAGDSAVVGTTIRVNGAVATVIGVMPPLFKFPERAELWTPIAPSRPTRSYNDRGVSVMARLKDGVTVAQAEAELRRISAGIASQHQAEFRNWTAGVETLREDLNADSGPPFLVLLGAAGFVLLIACANLANMLLARAMARERDFGVRTALGGSRTRLVRLLMAESLILSLAGGVLGLVVALWGMDGVAALIPDEIPFWIQFKLDARVLAFTFGVSLVTGLVFGLVPAVRVSRSNLHETLKEGQRSSSASRGRGRLRGALVVSEFALALVLLAGAGLMMKTYLVASRTDDLGYDPHGVLTARAELRNDRYRDPAQVRQFGQQVLERLQATPGAGTVSLESERFLGTFVGTHSGVTVEGAAEPVPDNVVPRFARGVTPDYFDLLRIPLRRGRAITSLDGPTAPLVAVLNEAAARVLFADRDALGKRFRIGGDTTPYVTVVGIVGDIAGAGRGRRRSAPFIYTSFQQQTSRVVTINVRTTGAPLQFAPTLRAAVTQVDGDQPLSDVQSMESAVGSWAAPVLFFVRILGLLAGIAILLAATGIYGVVSYSVSQRMHEIGIRVALGASSPLIVRLVLTQVLWLGGLGAALGLLGSFGLTRVLQQILYGTSPTDPTVLALVSATLVTVAVAAGLIPARRALRVNPVDALRND